MPVIETVAEGEHPLVVVHVGTTVDGASRLDEIVLAQGHLERSVDEAGVVGAGQRGSEVLLPGKDLELHGFAQIFRERQRFVRAAAETAVEACVARIGMHVDPGQAAEGDSEHLVEGIVFFAGVVVESEVGAEPDLLKDLDPGAGAEALHQVFVEQAGLDQTGVERW